MKVKDVIKYLDSMAPPQFQEGYDNSGLIVGQSSNDVNGILVCLDCIEEVVQEAIDLKCNLIIAHHPIIFSGLKKINPVDLNEIQKKIVLALNDGIEEIDAIHSQTKIEMNILLATLLELVLAGKVNRIGDQIYILVVELDLSTN
jgi:putative NIF3 family GTP cyclohydrolase 1 type 2